MTAAWQAVVDGVMDARQRAHMKQLSYIGLYRSAVILTTSGMISVFHKMHTVP